MNTSSDIDRLLERFPVVVVQPVQWGEQDAFGHVNHTVYFRWYESARIAYALKVGLMELHATQGIGPILASASNDYRRQLTYPDAVHIGVRISRIGRASLAMEHVIVSADQRAIAAEGTSTLVVFDYKTNRPHPVPDADRQAIEQLEGRSVSAS
jgi:acyl-CoA thioester hydrolase